MSVSFYFLTPFQQWSKWLQLSSISPTISPTILSLRQVLVLCFWAFKIQRSVSDVGQGYSHPSQATGSKTLPRPRLPDARKDTACPGVAG
ncbi:unnamed protein product, partial [Gulo gulo]